MFFFVQFFTFFRYFFASGSEKIYIDTNNNSHQIVQSIVDKKDNFSFSSMLFACRNLLLIAKKIAVLILGRNHCRGYNSSWFQ